MRILTSMHHITFFKVVNVLKDIGRPFSGLGYVTREAKSANPDA